MTPADFYRQRAEECFLLMQQVSDPLERGIIHELALCWLRLLERRTKKGPTMKGERLEPGGFEIPTPSG
jgi:hypothetical protein